MQSPSQSSLRKSHILDLLNCFLIIWNWRNLLARWLYIGDVVYSSLHARRGSWCQFVPLLVRLCWIPGLRGWPIVRKPQSGWGRSSAESCRKGEIEGLKRGFRARNYSSDEWGKEARRLSPSTEKQPSPSEQKAYICPGACSLPRAWRNTVFVSGGWVFISSESGTEFL